MGYTSVRYVPKWLLTFPDKLLCVDVFWIRCDGVGHGLDSVICNFWHAGTLPERQSARVLKIQMTGLTRSGTGCFIAVPIWQLTVGVNGANTRKGQKDATLPCHEGATQTIETQFFVMVSVVACEFLIKFDYNRLRYGGVARPHLAYR